MEWLLIQIRKINEIFQKSDANSFSYHKISEILGGIMNANFYIVLTNGTIVGDYYTHREDSPAYCDGLDDIKKYPEEENEILLKIEKTIDNYPIEEGKRIFPSFKNMPDKFHMFIPVYGGGKRLGALIIARYDSPFEMHDIILGEHVSTVVGVEIERRMDAQQKKESREKETVKLALESLSFSELLAIKAIADELKENEGIIVGSKIANQTDITRSTVVTCLKSLESAGIIETRSLGMKGTKIRILNNYLMKELVKIRL